MFSRSQASQVTLGVIAALLLAACGTSGGPDADESGTWSFRDGSGEVVTLDATPKRIIAHSGEAAALMSFGLKPVGIFADEKITTDPNLRDLDLSGIAILGEEWGKIDVEKAASLRPDLIVADWWPAEKAHSGLESGVEAKSKKLKELAPAVGASQGESILGLAEGYERLADELGANVDSARLARDKKRFERARGAFEKLARSRPDLTVAAMSPYEDKLYVANPAYAPELLDFKRWGLNVLTPAKPDKGFPYWQTLSMENADTYQPDVILWDDRANRGNVAKLNREYGAKQPTWFSVRAAKAGSVVSWPAFWIHTYGDYATELEELTSALAKADDSIGDE